MWIGHGVIVVSGVAFGLGAIVGAGSVVTKNVEDFADVAGNTARFIKHRFDEVARAWLSNLSWWDWSNDKVARNIDKLMKPATNNDFEIINYQQRRIIKIKSAGLDTSHKGYLYIYRPK